MVYVCFVQRRSYSHINVLLLLKFSFFRVVCCIAPYFLTGGKWLYSVVLVSAVQQCKSAIKSSNIGEKSWCSKGCREPGIGQTFKLLSVFLHVSGQQGRHCGALT